MTGFDWPGLMRAGLRGLRLTPREFWQLTPAELALMLGQSGGNVPMGRAQLDALLKAYPDKSEVRE
ncbi:MAG: rcc01693 family protein [Cognatishimia sp.]